MADERFEGRGQSDASFLEVLLALKQNVMRDIHVASFGKVKTVDGNKVKVQQFPLLTDEVQQTIETVTCVKDLEVGDIVYVVFADRNFMLNVSQAEKNVKFTDLDNDEELHSNKFGVIIAKLILGGNENARN